MLQKKDLQAQLDSLFLEINDTKISVKKLNAQHEQLDKQNREWRQEYYRSKLERYQALLRKTRQDLEQYQENERGESFLATVNYYFFCTPKIKKLQKKQDILSDLVEITRRLSLDPVVYLDDFVLKLEKKLIGLTCEDDAFFLLEEPYFEATFVVVKKRELERKLKALRKTLRFISKVARRRFCRDLRYSYRTIIRFLFKNMDDLSSDDNGLFLPGKNNFIVYSLTNQIHEFKNYNRAVKIYS